MSSEIVPFVDGNDTPPAEPHAVSFEKGECLKRTEPINTGKGKAVLRDNHDDIRKGKAAVVEHAIRRPLGPIEEAVRPFDSFGFPLERLYEDKRFWGEADLIGDNHVMRHYIPPKKGPKCVTKFNPMIDFVKTLLKKIKEPSVLQLRGCDQLFTPYVSPFSFDKFKTLICLEISGVSNFTTFPENTISEMTQLQFLDLSHLPIPQLPSSDFFSKLVHLRSLTLKDCPNIRFLPEFPPMTALEYLELSHLPIPHLPTDFFSKLIHLRFLTLKDCPKIHSLPKLPKMIALEYLELSHLLIATLPDDLFYCLRKLDRLILRGCSKLSSLPTAEISKNFFLRELDLSHCIALQENELGKLTGTFLKLDLSYTNLLKLFDTTKPSRGMSIYHLFLRDTKVINFERFPYSYLLSLTVLDVSGSQCVNGLDLLKTSTTRLEALDLSRTRIEFGYPIDFISFMECLRYLILRDCTWLQKLPAMKNLTELEVLDISGCENLGDLPEDFSSLKNLKELNLSGCSCLKESSLALFDEMTFLENFPRLTNLRTLNISKTPSNGKVETHDLAAAAPESRIENLHPRLSKPNEFYIVSTFLTDSGFDRFKQHFDLIVDLISRFQENFEPVSSLDTIPIGPFPLNLSYIIKTDEEKIKTDAESCPIGGQTVKMQCRRLIADLEYIRDNIGLLESCPSCTMAENLLDELTSIRSQFEPRIFKWVDDLFQHFYFRLNSTNFYGVLQRVAKLKLLVPRKGVDVLEEQKNKKEKLEGRLGDEQHGILEDIDMNTPEMQNLSSFYESLTNTQKNCLLHFTVFEKFCLIKKRMLIELWYSEGLIDPQHEENVGLSNANSTANPLPTPNQEITSPSIEVGATSTTFWQNIEEIGQQILMVLQEKLFVDRFDARFPKASPFWGLTTDAYNFVRARAMAEGFFNVDRKTRMITPHLSNCSERACLLIPEKNLPSSCKLWVDYTNSSEKIKCFKTIRTLLNVNVRIVEIRAEWFSKMTNLFVFHLGRCQTPKYKHESIEVMDLMFLEELKNMKKLRLLNLDGFLAIKKLPDSVCKVTNLRILNLRECGYLEELPAGIGSLKNLTHLDLTNCRILPMLPKGIRLLSKLEVLKGFIITYQIGGRQHRNACTLRDLLKLEKLRTLKLVVHTEGFPFPDSSDLHILNRMKNLCNLRIEWQHNYNALDQQHPGIVRQKTSSRWHWHRLKCQPVCFWKHVFLFHLFSNRPEQRMSQNDTVKELSSSNIKQLELRCFPFETPPSWLQPSGLKNLERLYVRGGKLKTLATNTNQHTWSVKFLRFRYLRNMYMDGEEFRCNFPHMTHFESYECDHLPHRQGIVHDTSEGIWVFNSKQEMCGPISMEVQRTAS